MNVRELIKQLETVNNKELPVVIYQNGHTGGAWEAREIVVMPENRRLYAAFAEPHLLINDSEDNPLDLD
jgi:hypothetical protein